MWNDMEKMLSKFAADEGLPAVSLDEHGYALLHIVGMAINVEYHQERERLYLYSSLGIMPAHPSTELCRALLEANFLGAATAGGHIGLHAPTGIITYSLSLDPTKLDHREFANALNLFAAHSSEWLGKVSTLLETPSLAPEQTLFNGAMLGNILWG